MQLGNTQIEFEDNDGRIKVTLPMRRNLPLLILYTILAILWAGLLLLFLYFLFWPSESRSFSGMPFALRAVWVLGVVAWLYMWVRKLGGRILRWWQYYLADREILFIDEKTMILRRPVSLFGLTDAYAMEHVAPFYVEERHDSVGFRYGNAQYILFGMTLPLAEQKSLVEFLNSRFFPNMEEDEEFEFE